MFGILNGESTPQNWIADRYSCLKNDSDFEPR